MEDGYLIDKAEIFAREKHEGQMKSEGVPYIEHCFHVATMASRDGANPILFVIGLLQHTLETSDATYKDIVSTFGPSIADAVQMLTHEEGETEEEYLKRVSKDPATSVIKLFDRLDDVRSLDKNPSLDERKKFKKETLHTFLPIFRESAYMKIGTYKSVLDEIEKICNE